MENAGYVFGFVIQKKTIDGKPQVVACHLKYHHSGKINETTGTTRSSVDSDLLTDES